MARNTTREPTLDPSRTGEFHVPNGQPLPNRDRKGPTPIVQDWSYDPGPKRGGSR